ncbi:hypothetical protein J699_01353 [Acinetobacter sp. 1000160]|nr:hypothetical protein J522_1050 [Acinetobacter baumannii 146457]EYT21692.1 hypothetical protein J699_01353 [Acinetobacter sp. 1000160]
MKYSIYFAFLTLENQNKRSQKKKANHLVKMICCAPVIILFIRPPVYHSYQPYYFL